ncbi:MAG: substrate-binding domain-containing protein [Bacteroidales bacterium]|nr:substrate-binding domain-containing protein [Bacteroidales bacterium]
MKVLKFIWVLIALAIFTSSCNHNPEKVKVGILFSSYKASRWPLENKYLEEKINELGGELITKITEGDELEQNAQADELFKQGIDVLIIIPVNANNAAGIVRKAHKKGIKVIAYDILVRNTDLDFFVTFTGVKAGEYMAEYTVKKIPEGNYILLYGDRSDKNAQDIHKGVRNVLNPYIEKGKIKILFESYTEQWATENAEHLAAKAIQFSGTKVDAIIATFNSITYGAEAAVKKYNLQDSILVVGHDPDIPVCKQILEGKDVLAVHKTVKSIAYKTAEIVFQLVNNQKIEHNTFINNGRMDVPSIVLDPVVINKNNIQQLIFDEGFIKKEDVLNYRPE